MSWNYRIVRALENGEPHYTIRTAYYDHPGDNMPHSIGDTPAYPSGSCLSELVKDLQLFNVAFNLTPLNDDSFAKADEHVALKHPIDSKVF